MFVAYVWNARSTLIDNHNPLLLGVLVYSLFLRVIVSYLSYSIDPQQKCKQVRKREKRYTSQTKAGKMTGYPHGQTMLTNSVLTFSH